MFEFFFCTHQSKSHLQPKIKTKPKQVPMKKTIEDTFTKRPGSATLALGILTTILFSIWWHFTRQPMECGPLADCVKYRQMTQSYLSGNYQPIDGPFHTRIATPWFASLTGHNIRQGFS